jgi:Leucine-rich repeat (LRR) protein
VGYQDTSNCEEPSLCDEEIEVELWGECYNIEETTTLILSGLTGEIPPEIGNLTNLIGLVLSSNQFIGGIPPEIGNLTNLTGLFLNNNQLTGRIPSEIGNLTNLTNLDLSDNELSEEIPPEIGNLTNLFQLLLNNNQLMGEIPESICNIDIFWISFPYFDIDNNQLCPPYPDCISEEDIGYQDTSECEEECILGDINNDSLLDILDIVSMINLILDGEYNECGDVNSDGTINVQDVVIFVNIILSGP